MKTLDTSITNIQHLKDLLEDKIRNDYLEKYIQKPKINEEKLRILAFLVEGSTTLSTVQKKNYVITAMMVQIALDTHELVPVHNYSDETKQEKLAKQLRVLAGDYYSSLYYFLLSEIDDFELIHTLATAIKKINEFKMKRYYKEVESFEEYLELTKQIDSTLIVHVANLLYGNSLNKLIDDWLLFDRMIHEAKKWQGQNRYPLLEEWQTIDNSDRESFQEEKMSALLVEYTTALNKAISELPNGHRYFQRYLSEKLNKTNYYLSSTMEEG